MSNPAARVAMSDRALSRLFWPVADGLDYPLTLAWLRILDALAGPEPETPADQKREADQERLASAFPKLAGGEPGAPVSHRADRVPTED